MANIKWSAPAAGVTVLSTELNSLANAARTNAGTEYNNSSNLYQQAIFRLTVTFGSAPTDGYNVGLYIVKATDGTTYEDGSSSIRPPSTALVGYIDLRNVTSAQVRDSFIVPLPPTKFKLILLNQSAVSFPSSGSTLVMYPFHTQVV